MSRSRRSEYLARAAAVTSFLTDTICLAPTGGALPSLPAGGREPVSDANLTAGG